MLGDVQIVSGVFTDYTVQQLFRDSDKHTIVLDLSNLVFPTIVIMLNLLHRRIFIVVSNVMIAIMIAISLRMIISGEHALVEKMFTELIQQGGA